jgi:hypothetical protein
MRDVIVKLVGGVVALAACAAPAAESKPVVEFPSAASLQAIGAQPAAIPEVTRGDVPADGWTVDVGPTLPASGTPWQPKGAWDHAIAGAISARPTPPRLTQALACVARELARYYLDNRVLPSDQLESFMVAACGSWAPRVGSAFLHGDVPGTVAEEAVLTAWKGKIDSTLLQHLPPGATDAGFAFERRHGRAAAVLTYAVVQAEIEPFSPTPGTDGELSFTGRLLGDAQYVAGYVNHGRFGVSPCFVDPTVPRPRFHVSCAIDPKDEVAWIQLVYAQPRRVLSVPFAQVLARREPGKPLAFPELPRAGAPVASAEAFSRAVIEELNRVRALADMKPVRLSVAQSATAAHVAGRYFAADTGKGAVEDEDAIALGLLAGWQVVGLIRDGSFVSTLVPQTRDPLRWLASTLQRPIGRSTLMDERIEEIALGPLLLDNPPAAGAIVVGYRFHNSDDHSSDVRRLLTRAATARRHRHLGPTARLGPMIPIMQEELARVRKGEQQPMEALQAVLERGVSHFNANMRGYLLETTSLDALEIPEEVLKQPNLYLEIGVTHHKPKGAAWGQLVILVAFVDYGKEQVALAHR